MGDAKAQGLAKEIRAANTSEQFDLQNYKTMQVTALVNAAFSTPISVQEMIAISFVVGGGKKVRQKYSDTLQKDLHTALRDIGYTEDRGASNSIDCAGSFKSQHDTDKDLMKTHVYPKVVIVEEVEEDDGDDYDDLLVVGMNNLRVHNHPPAMISAVADMDDFKRLVVEYCPSFSQRKGLLKDMKGMLPEMKEIEGKLARMESLSPAEDEFYNSIESLHDKIAGLSNQIQGMLSRGHLSKSEIKQFLPDMKGKMEQLDKMLEGAKGKKLAKLEEQKQMVSEKIEALQYASGQRGFVPTSSCAGAVDTELCELRKREANSMGSDRKLDRRIEFLAVKRRGWYPDLLPKEEVKQKRVTKKAAAKKSSSSSSGGGWATQSSKKGKSGRNANQRKTNAGGGGANLFAMLGDSD